MTITQLGDIQISSPADRDKLFKVIKELDNSLTRIDGEKDYIKSATEDVSKELGIPKNLITKMAKVYHKQNFDQEVATQEQFQHLYETIVK